MNERQGVCVILCELCVGQLLLLARFTRAAWWLHGTVTPCPHVSLFLFVSQIRYSRQKHTLRLERRSLNKKYFELLPNYHRVPPFQKKKKGAISVSAVNCTQHSI